MHTKHILMGAAAAALAIAATVSGAGATTPKPVKNGPVKGGPTDSWISLGGAPRDTPSIVHLDAQDEHISTYAVFIRGEGDSLWYKIGSDGAWTNLGGKFDGAPTCVGYPGYHWQVDCFVRSPGLAVWHIQLFAGMVKKPWENLGGQITGNPGYDNGYVVAKGTDGKLWSLELSTGWGGKPGPWTLVGDTGPEKLHGSPACVYNSPNRLRCAVTTSTGVAEFFPIGTKTVPPIGYKRTLAIDTPYDPTLVSPFLATGMGYIQNSTRHLRYILDIDSPAAVQNPLDMGGIATSGVTCTHTNVTGDDGHLTCAVRGTDNAVWVNDTYVPYK